MILALEARYVPTGRGVLHNPRLRNAIVEFLILAVRMTSGSYSCGQPFGAV